MIQHVNQIGSTTNQLPVTILSYLLLLYKWQIMFNYNKMLCFLSLNLGKNYNVINSKNDVIILKGSNTLY